VISRLRAWIRSIIGVRCPWCGGEGIYYAYSPVASLSTIRHAQPYRCGKCEGTGRVAS
jgi:Ribonuclease G/E